MTVLSSSYSAFQGNKEVLFDGFLQGWFMGKSSGEITIDCKEFPSNFP